MRWRPHNEGVPTVRQPAEKSLESAITIRLAHGGDAAELRRLAALDSADVPAGPLLLVEVEGILRVALSLADDSSIADPFHPTDDLAALVRERARAARARRSRPAWWSLSRVRAAARLA